MAGAVRSRMAAAFSGRMFCYWLVLSKFSSRYLSRFRLPPSFLVWILFAFFKLS
ncbi:hypothetical protein BDZ97DRAFT_1792674 [Flammula alnicola]|nr:hypothetical protein BDZ97DRAFT_1792674 [Flammula alnicola]